MSILPIRNMGISGVDTKVLYDNGLSDYQFIFNRLERESQYYDGTPSTATVTFNPTNMYCRMVASGGAWCSQTLVTTQKINVKKYTRMKIEIATSFTSNGYNFVVVGMTDNIVTPSLVQASAKQRMNTPVSKTTITIDISALDGEYAPFVELGGNAGQTVTATITKWWFE